mgnify:CR=1 FL=1
MTYIIGLDFLQTAATKIVQQYADIYSERWDDSPERRQSIQSKSWNTKTRTIFGLEDTHYLFPVDISGNYQNGEQGDFRPGNMQFDISDDK